MRPTPVFRERALVVHDGDSASPTGGARGEGPTLVVGDLHVGLETDLRRGGVHLPSRTRTMRDRLVKLVGAEGARRVVIIGDLKHEIPARSRQEHWELPDLFLGFPVPVELVRGNHDVDLPPMPGVTVHGMEGIVAGDVGLFHGHVWPDAAVMRQPTVVSCHNHPMVLLMDELGHRHKEPCWVRASFTPAARERYPGLPVDAQLVVMPAFNELLGGVAFNAREGARVLGPLWANGLADVDAARLYTLDGVDLGTVADLRDLGDIGRPRAARGWRTLGE